MAKRPAFRKRGKGKKKGARKGKMSNNSKVNLNATYKLFQPYITQTATAGTAGNYGYSAFSPMNATAVSVNQSAEFMVQAKLYDEFCVTSMTVTYIPNATENNLATGLGSGQQNSLHSWVDRDGGTPVSTSIDSVKAIQAYDSAKRGTIIKRHSRTVKCKRFWQDCNQNSLSAPFQLTSPYAQAGLLQLVGFYVEKLPFAAATTLGSFLVSWKVAFRGKKAMNLSYDPLSGSVIMTPLSSYPHVKPGNEPLTEDQVLAGDQSIHCDLSGNIQIVSNLDGTIAVALSGEGN